MIDLHFRRLLTAINGVSELLTNTIDDKTKMIARFMITDKFMFHTLDMVHLVYHS